MKRFANPNPNESRSLLILNKGRCLYKRIIPEGKTRGNRQIIKGQIIIRRLSFTSHDGFYTPPVHIVASERIESTTRRFPRTESVEPSVAPAIACLRSSPAISHLAAEPDSALSVPTDNWTNRSHSLRANCSSPSHPPYRSFFFLFLLSPYFLYPYRPPRPLLLISFPFLSISYESYFSQYFCIHRISIRFSTLIIIFSVYVLSKEKTSLHPEKESGIIEIRVSNGSSST